uniref:Uncharacterized protein n=1 Tax=Brassica oleracea TaxID=3712 RepID=A0A3P6D5F0_BRAOL|nr:unnamed protein product [Brassica oleracea]
MGRTFRVYHGRDLALLEKTTGKLGLNSIRTMRMSLIPEKKLGSIARIRRRGALSIRLGAILDQ